VNAEGEKGKAASSCLGTIDTDTQIDVDNGQRTAANTAITTSRG